LVCVVGGLGAGVTLPDVAQAVSGSVGSPAELRTGRAVAADALARPAVRGLLARLMVRNAEGREVIGGRPLAPRLLEGDRAIVRLPGTRAAAGAHLDVQVDAIDANVAALTVRPGASLDARQIGFRLPIARHERLHGLGERFGAVELRGQVVDSWVEDRHIDPDRRTSYSPSPVLLSTAGWGMVLDTNSRVHFDVGARTAHVLRVRADTGVLRVWVLRGEPKALLRQASGLVGRAPVPPEWGLGVWKALIGGEERVLADLRRLQRAGVPLDAVWSYDLVDRRSGFGWPWPIHDPIPPGAYPDPARLVDELHRRGLRVLGYLNPFVVEGTPAFRTAVARGLLLHDGTGRPLIRSWQVSADTRVRHGVVDVARPAARRWWQRRIAHGLEEVGFDGAMQDFGEGLPSGAAPSGSLRPGLAHNRTPVLYGELVRRAAQAVKPDATVFFARAGYLGSQAHSTGRFTGDQQRSWDRERGLPSVLRAMLSGSLSGWPYWGPDIAGFTTAPDDVRDEKELWLRWLQLGALSPVMRDMLGDQRRAVGALTDRETLTAFRAYARLHTALRPYLHALARAASRTGLPIVRPLFVEHPDDETAAGIEDQYLLGRDLLVAPVVRPGQVRRRVYLPPGDWTDYWTGRRLPGGRWHVLCAPRHRIPLLHRSGGGSPLPDPAALWAEPADGVRGGARRTA
jgi:alpha-glucosidase